MTPTKRKRMFFIMIVACFVGLVVFADPVTRAALFVTLNLYVIALWQEPL